MSAYKVRYFIALGPQAEQVSNEALERVKRRNESRNALLSELGAIGYYERSHDIPTHVVFDSADHRPGFIKSHSLPHEGKAVYAFRPDRRTKIGKDVIAKLEGVPLFNLSDYLCRAFKVSHMTVVPNGSGMALATSVAGVVQDHLVFKIPFGGMQGGQDSADVQIPEGFRELSESQFIAFTREGKPLEQLAA